MTQRLASTNIKHPLNSIKKIVSCTSSANEPVLEVGDLLVAYLKQLNVDFVYGVPGGAIEPLYNALARSERNGGPRSVVARHECGAVFMADGYHRNSGKLGVCCTTTGPGATNAITGIAMAYENNIPLLIITAQTALSNFGKKALQESSDTGIDTTGMFKFCTHYSTMVSHAAQFETKLITAIMTALGSRKGPVHLSIPLDILRSASPVLMPTYDLLSLSKEPCTYDEKSIHTLSKLLLSSKNPVFLIGSGCGPAVDSIMQVANLFHAKIITTPDGKGFINPIHPQHRGVIGFAGHQSATNLLADQNVDLLIAIGTTLGEWTSNGWDKDTILNNRLVHVDPIDNNIMRSPMARLHVRGHLPSIFDQLNAVLVDSPAHNKQLNPHKNVLPLQPSINHSIEHTYPFTMENPESYLAGSNPIKPQWLMRQLTRLLPPNTLYLVDSGNSFAWATHYLHPISRRVSDQRGEKRQSKDRRNFNHGLFQSAVEFSSMGWAIGSAIGAAMASSEQTVVAITGDGSWLMSGQEITTAIQEKLGIIYIILNDSALGMVKHGQRLAGAEPIGFKLPSVNFCDLATSMGADGYLINDYQELLNLDIKRIINRKIPCVIDVRIDPDQVPPMGLRMKVLQA